MQISVTGQEQRRVAPERAEVRVTVARQGSDRSGVVAQATALANELAAAASGLKESGAVTQVTVQPLQASVWRRGPRSPEQFTASVDLAVTFADFEVLGRTTGDWATREDVRIGWVRWFLTDETTERLTDACIAGAVERARTRAEAMARAAGAGAIEIVEIADPSLLSAPEATIPFGGGPRPMLAMARSAAEPEEPVRIEPEPIEVGATLQLRFATR